MLLNLSSCLLPSLVAAAWRGCCHSGGSRNPEKWNGFRVEHGMTFDTPILAGVVHLPPFPVDFRMIRNTGNNKKSSVAKRNPMEMGRLTKMPKSP